MKRLVLAVLLLTIPLALAVGAPPSKKEIKKLKQEIARAASEGNWDAVGAHMEQLSEANDRKVWKFMVKVAEKAPREYELHRILRQAAEKMTSSSVQNEIRRTAIRSKSALIRRQLIVHLANQKDWDTLIDALKDKDEQVASLAAWRLIDNRVEAAMEPMLTLLEKLERNRDGIWDVLKNGLGRMLGKSLQSAMEYRSLWQIVQDQGGLESVAPEKEETEIQEGGLKSMSVRLFGREIDCTRVVFILDVSGSMETIDPQAWDPETGYGNSRVRGGGPSGADGEAANKPKGKTRLQRAQRELKNVLKHLPSNFKVNVVAYSSRVKIWRANEGDIPPQLHELNQKNRDSSAKFVDDFRADGVTCTNKALLRAYDVEGVRCFYLLSDGMATEDGTTPIPTEELIQILEDFKDRHVIVHTLGFRGADREMMKALAKHTGGKYSDIK